MEKILLIDTSSMVTKKFEVLKVQYPLSQWIWVISEDTFFELTEDVNKEKAYLKIGELYETYRLCTALGYHDIVKLECEKKLFFNNKNVLYPKEWEKILKLDEGLKDMEPCNPINYQTLTINDIDIKTSEVIKYVVQNSNLDLKVGVKANEIFNICRDLLIKHENKMAVFAKQYPSSYSLLKIQGLVNTLKIPKNQKSFRFMLENETINIRIDKNFIVDMRIGAATLPYIDGFFTKEPGQATLLRMLFPEHAYKVCIHEDAKECCNNA